MRTPTLTQTLRMLLLVVVFGGGISSSNAQGAFGHSKVGIELEYAARQKTRSLLDAKNHVLLLGFARAEFGGSAIRVGPWEKFSIVTGATEAFFRDERGRRWAVVPEKMETEVFDGLEEITPPLETAEDVEKFGRVIDATRKSGKFVRGRSSSTHYTYDISHLIGKNDADRENGERNIAKFVDLVLFLETNVVSMYNQTLPERYGHTVNEFAVPLAINQKQLLKELAELPREQRTFNRVRNIFRRYERREIDMVAGQDGHAWKYRAFNYGKIFGLGRFEEWNLPVIEVRLADLVQDSATFKRLGTLFARAIAVGAETPVTKFNDPFPDFWSFFTGNRDHQKIDEFIRSQPNSESAAFLKLLNRENKSYPLYGRCESLFVPATL